jgi:NitT/TauT family transport system substrate-binding protein
MRKTVTLAALAILAVTQTARAEDSLKIAIGQINNWENQAPTLGQDAGIFKKHNLNLENFGTAGAGETIQAVISGSAESVAVSGLPAPCAPSPRARRCASSCRPSPGPAISTGT